MINVDGEVIGINAGLTSYMLKIRGFNPENDVKYRIYGVIIPFREAVKYEARTGKEIKIGMKLAVRGKNPLSFNTRRGLSELCDENGEIILLLAPKGTN